MDNKICSKCNEEKSLLEFTMNGKYPYSKCRSCVRSYHKDYLANPENKEKAKVRSKNWSKDNQEKIILRRKEYRLRKNELARKEYKEKYKVNLFFTLKLALRRRLKAAFKKNYKTGSAVKELGCSIEYIKAHLELKFKPGMSWENYGQWHIDHIKPLSSFNLDQKEEVKLACHYTNLQPLWEKENLLKGAKYE